MNASASSDDRSRTIWARLRPRATPRIEPSMPADYFIRCLGHIAALEADDYGRMVLRSYARSSE